MTQQPTILCPWPEAEDEALGLALGIKAALASLTLRDGTVLQDDQIREVMPDLDDPDEHAPAVAVGRVMGRLSGQGLAAMRLADEAGWVLFQDDDLIGEVDVVCWGQTPQERSMLMAAVKGRLSSHGPISGRLAFDVPLPDYFPGTNSKARLTYRGPRQEDGEIEVMRRHRIGYQTFQFRMPVLRAEWVGVASVIGIPSVAR